MLNMVNTVIKNAIHRPVTRTTRRAPFTKARGRLEIDIEKCIFCGMCQRRCPAGAITVDRAAKDWTLNPFACIICGECVAACPKKCLSLSNAWRESAVAKVPETKHQEPKPVEPDRKVAN